MRRRLPFALALDELLHFMFVRSARDTGGALGFRRGFLTGCAFEALAFGFIFNVLGVHSSILIPAYFSTIFLSPYPGKLIVSFASSPSPSRRKMVPRPYFGCFTVAPTENPEPLGERPGRDGRRSGGVRD